MPSRGSSLTYHGCPVVRYIRCDSSRLIGLAPTRVNTLLTGSGVSLLDATKVTNNGGGNTMTGNHGGVGELNLFYGLDPTLETTDYNSSAREQVINC